MSSETIRAGQLSDVRRMAEVQLRAALTGYRHIFPTTAPKPSLMELEREWAGLCEDPDTVVLVAEAEAIVGCIAARSDGSVPTGFLLDRLYVDPDHWGKGVGQALHDSCLTACRDLGARSINLWVLEKNERARVLYERWGWRLVSGQSQSTADGTVREVMYQHDTQNQ